MSQKRKATPAQASASAGGEDQQASVAHGGETTSSTTGAEQAGAEGAQGSSLPSGSTSGDGGSTDEGNGSGNAGVLDGGAGQHQLATAEVLSSEYPKLMRLYNHSGHELVCRSSGVVAAAGGTATFTVTSEEHGDAIADSLMAIAAASFIPLDKLVIQPA